MAWYLLYRRPMAPEVSSSTMKRICSERKSSPARADSSGLLLTSGNTAALMGAMEGWNPSTTYQIYMGLA